MKLYPLVSVVIPVFNEEKYLYKCIESVLLQSYNNIECIILDNCSTDSSLDIARQFEKLDKRIVVYTNERFLSMLENHNKSLRLISPSSKYCKMVLGDDFIFRDCIEKMVVVAESDPTVGIVSSYRILGTQVAGLGLPVSENSIGYSIYNGREVCKYLLLKDDIHIFGNQTTVMYDSDIVRNRNPFFNESSLFADAEVCYEILKGRNLGFIYQILSFARINNNSASSSFQDYRPALPIKLGLLCKYWKCYMNSGEYENRYHAVLNEYYDYMGLKFFTQRKRDFWEFHEKELSKIGIKIERSKILKHAVMCLLNWIFNPKRTIEYIFKKYSKKC